LVCQNFGLIPSASKPKNGRLLEIESLGLSIEKSLSTRLSSWHRPHFSRLQMFMFITVNGVKYGSAARCGNTAKYSPTVPSKKLSQFILMT